MSDTGSSIVRIHGDGVAALCCAHLLNRAGFLLAWERTSRPRLPAILLSQPALALMRDVFDRPGLLQQAHHITRRVVQWGRNVEPAAFDHDAIVISERELIGELAVQAPPEDPAARTPAFTIFASRPVPGGAVEQRFGTRTAAAAAVRLKDPRDSASCWIESLDDGWLFLIPHSAEAGWLLSVGGSVDAAARRSFLIAGRIASWSAPSGEFAASPRILSPLGGSHWLACGTAGMAFDPICGDGTAYAVREAILAAAVVKAISAGGDATELLHHYQARLVLGFQRHLATSMTFYRSGNGGEWWERETALLQQGLEWCASQLQTHSEFRYQLSGFDLKSIDSRRR